MSAVLALLIGIAVGEGASALTSPVESLGVFVYDATPGDRRTTASRIGDAETVGAMPSGTVMVERRIIIRIPMLPRVTTQAPAFVPQTATVTGPRRSTCLAMRAIRGAMFPGRAGVLFVTTSNGQYRATLERGCSPVDFQSGFYLDSPADGAICAGRDVLHSRSGARCTIVAFTRMAPAD